jgi:predicted metal-binding membrane protein
MNQRAWRLAEPWMAILLLAEVFAWSLLFFRHATWSLPGMCSVVTVSGLDLYTSLRLMRDLNPPESLALSWGVMGFAMTAPLLLAPVQYVRERSFIRRRVAETFLFALAYQAIWFLAGVALLPLALILRSLLSGSIVRVVTIAIAIAIGWQFSPAKQRCLNCCHRRPPLAASGWAANRDALAFGLTIGAACLGACWAMTLAALCMPHGHVTAMFVVTLFAACERLEIPGAPVWRWRGTGKAMRITTFRVHLLLRTCCALESWSLDRPLKCGRD